MARTFVLFIALLAVGVVPAEAQHTWTADRPDGVAPPSVFAGSTVPAGQIELFGAYRKTDLNGIKFGTQFLTIDETFDLFEVAPLSMTSEILEVRVGVGLTDRLTLAARTGLLQKSREQLTADQFFIVEVDDLTDTEVHLLWQVTSGESAVRAHLQGGVSLPTGSVEETADISGVRTGILPYDMQTGAGVFGVVPGATIEMQNEVGTVGAQVLGRLYFGENDRGWRPGNAIEANGWAAYMVNEYVGVTAGVRALGWAAIEGFDATLDPFRDPGELSLSYGGVRVDVPVGLNVRIASGPLAGHRLGFEWISNVHENLDGPWLASDQGFVISWTASLGAR